MPWVSYKGTHLSTVLVHTQEFVPSPDGSKTEGADPFLLMLCLEELWCLGRSGPEEEMPTNRQ